MSEIDGVAGGAMGVGADIVDIEDIDAIEAETRIAEFDRAHDGIVAVVVVHVEVQRLDVGIVRHRALRHRM
ncbi:hypothetical protein D3C72_2039340 [compost metagenome]